MRMVRRTGGTVKTAEAFFHIRLAEADLSKALTISSGDWLRIEPDAISKPLHTASY